MWDNANKTINCQCVWLCMCCRLVCAVVTENDTHMRAFQSASTILLYRSHNTRTEHMYIHARTHKHRERERYARSNCSIPNYIFLNRVTNDDTVEKKGPHALFECFDCIKEKKEGARKCELSRLVFDFRLKCDCHAVKLIIIKAGKTHYAAWNVYIHRTRLKISNIRCDGVGKGHWLVVRPAFMPLKSESWLLKTFITFVRSQSECVRALVLVNYVYVAFCIIDIRRFGPILKCFQPYNVLPPICDALLSYHRCKHAKYFVLCAYVGFCSWCRPGWCLVHASSRYEYDSTCQYMQAIR